MKHFSSQYATFLLRSVFIALFLLAPLSVFAASFSSREVADRVNHDRAMAGLSALRFDDTLSKAAELKAEDMKQKGYFAHTSPDGTTPWYFFEKAGYSYRYAGENLAIHFADAKSEETAWMASEKHRENILSPKYRDTGVAVLEIPWEGATTILTVQLFGTSMGESVSDVSLWKNLSTDAPVVSGAMAAESQSAPSNAPSSAPASVALSGTSLLPNISLQALTVLFLSLIGLLEISAAGIVYRILIRHGSLQRNSTPL